MILFSRGERGEDTELAISLKKEPVTVEITNFLEDNLQKPLEVNDKTIHVNVKAFFFLHE